MKALAVGTIDSKTKEPGVSLRLPEKDIKQHLSISEARALSASLTEAADAASAGDGEPNGQIET